MDGITFIPSSYFSKCALGFVENRVKFHGQFGLKFFLLFIIIYKLDLFLQDRGVARNFRRGGLTPGGG